MQRLNRQVDRINDLVNGLLDTTRVAEGRLILERESIDLNELVAERLEDFCHLSNNHKVRIQAGTVTKVLADRTRIAEVVNNFVSNAIKYSPNGGEVLLLLKTSQKELS